MLQRRCVVLAVTIGVWAWSHAVFAQSSGTGGRPISLAWDANDESSVRGYIVYVGTTSQSPSSTYDVGNATSFSFTAGVPGQTYYFAVAAYGDRQLVGPPSSEV